MFRNSKTQNIDLLGQAHPSLLISTWSLQLDCREAGDFSCNKVDIVAGPTNVWPSKDQLQGKGLIHTNLPRKENVCVSIFCNTSQKNLTVIQSLWSINHLHSGLYLLHMFSSHSFSKIFNLRQGIGWWKVGVLSFSSFWFPHDLREFSCLWDTFLISSLAEESKAFKPIQSRDKRQKLRDCISLTGFARFF